MRQDTNFRKPSLGRQIGTAQADATVATQRTNPGPGVATKIVYEAVWSQPGIVPSSIYSAPMVTPVGCTLVNIVASVRVAEPTFQLQFIVYRGGNRVNGTYAFGIGSTSAYFTKDRGEIPDAQWSEADMTPWTIFMQQGGLVASDLTIALRFK